MSNENLNEFKEFSDSQQISVDTFELQSKSNIENENQEDSLPIIINTSNNLLLPPVSTSASLLPSSSSSSFNKRQKSFDNLYLMNNNENKNKDMPSIEQSSSSSTSVIGVLNETISLNSTSKTNSDNEISYIFKELNNSIINNTGNNSNNKDNSNDDTKISEDNNEFMEKTEDLIAKALKIALEEKKELLRKTELVTDKDQEESIEREQEEQFDLTDNMMMRMSSPPPGVATDSQGLILPKKIINPCLESTDRQNLHRELMFNQKIGKSVLNQKSELQRALEKQKERQLILQQKLQEEQDPGLKGELNRVIMERQQKLEKKNNQDDEISSQLNPEYLNARAKLRARIDTK